MSRRRSSAGTFFVAVVAASAFSGALGAPTPSAKVDTYTVAAASDSSARARSTPVFTPGKPITLFTNLYGDHLPEHELARRALYSPPLTPAKCLPRGTNSTVMQTILSQNGDNATVPLCPGTTYALNTTLIFTSPYQQIITVGKPTGSTRATLQIVNPLQSVAVWGACDQCTGVALRNIQINGARPALGRLSDGAALVELGGNPSDQVVDNSHIYEPRGWSCVHYIEGWNNNCRRAIITNNQIGPSGNSPNTAQQFRRRQTTVIGGGQWADGISLSCGASTVTGNTITDATDGGIVIFGSPGSQITGNTIISSTRVAMGGINLVDYDPWGGSFQDVVVSGNTLRTDGAMIKLGIAMGTLSWSSANSTDYRTFGATVQNNVFQSSSGSFAYGISAAGHMTGTVSGNVFTKAKFLAAQSAACIDGIDYPTPQAFVYDPWTTSGTYSGANQGELAFLICMMQAQYGTPYSLSSSIAATSTSQDSTSSSTAAVASVTTAATATTVSTTASSSVQALIKATNSSSSKPGKSRVVAGSQDDTTSDDSTFSNGKSRTIPSKRDLNDSVFAPLSNKRARPDGEFDIVLDAAHAWDRRAVFDMSFESEMEYAF